MVTGAAWWPVTRSTGEAIEGVQSGLCCFMPTRLIFLKLMIDESAATSLLQNAWRQRLPAPTLAARLALLGTIDARQVLGTGHRERWLMMLIDSLRRAIQVCCRWKLASHGLHAPSCSCGGIASYFLIPPFILFDRSFLHLRFWLLRVWCVRSHVKLQLSLRHAGI